MAEFSLGRRNALYKHQKQMVALGGGEMRRVYLRGWRGCGGRGGVKLYPPVPRGGGGGGGSQTGEA